jgi:2'-5' RNA ligase
MIQSRIGSPFRQTSYNFFVQGSRYALVAYVRNPVGEFVEQLRGELHPELAHLAAHVTVLPPRRLPGSEFAALQTLEEVCGRVEPFEVNLGEVETFIPVTPTVFIRVVHAASRIRDLHDKLNTGGLHFEEEWPYMPHITIVKMGTEDQAQNAYRTSQRRWAQFKGDRSIRIEELVFVREEAPNRWKDLAGVRLGRGMAPGKTAKNRDSSAE